MAKTLVGLYNGGQTARQVIAELTAAGCDRSDITYIIPAQDQKTAAGDSKQMMIPGIGPAYVDESFGASGSNLVDGLASHGVDRTDAEIYAEGIHRGYSLVIAHTSDDVAQKAVDVMNRFQPIDVQDQASRWRQSGWIGFSHEARPYSAEEQTRFTQEESIPVVKEDVSIGKRQVEGGGVRIRTYVVERPVEETVSLRQEKVDVQRRPVDRPLQPGEQPFQEREYKVSETDEEAVVSKQARVVEEVEIRKTEEKQDRVIREKVKETKVDVDPVKDPKSTRPGGQPRPQR